MDCLEGLKLLDDNSIDCCVTSPPYWGLRDYGVEKQLGLEDTPEEYVENIVKVFSEVKRVLKEDGTLWLNLGDSYSGSGKGRNPDGTVHVSSLIAKQGTSAGTVMGNVKSGIVPNGLKPKDLVGIPWRVAFALQSDGWYLRQDIIWAKPNPMPESVKDRCTKSHEYIFLLTKSAQYYYDNEAIRETAKNANKTISLGEKSFSKRQAKGVGVEPSGNGKSDNYTVKEYRNKRSVWTVATKPFKGAHFAVFPPALIEPCILAGCREGGIVLDPFMGSGTTGLVAKQQNKNYIGFEMNSKYCDIANKRISEHHEQLKIVGD
ncbi:MAG: Modification methylase DpnIIB [bacterium ADurb.Bin212]|nr:MAG: Modification methylase DpnIIB [bacterium ADurb.Bin212]